MTEPTEHNITGVKSFDHSPLAHLPEYQQAAKALDDLVKAIDRAGIELGQARFLDTTRDITTALSYADSCPACDNDLAPTFPHAAQVDDGWLTGTYRCSQCGNRWTCGYAVNIGMWF